jgi:riboflavin synthase
VFTGILQGIATVRDVTDKPGLRSFTLGFPPLFARGLQLGASVSVDGVCLTVTRLRDEDAADFDVILQSLSLTTLGELRSGDHVNVERAAAEGAEVGGHTLSGHIDFTASICDIRLPQNNRLWRLAVPAPWMRYLFAKGYVALSGASLTLAEVHRDPDGSGWFEVWLIPETLRITTFGDRTVGQRVNVEIDRQTQILVDTIRDELRERLGPLRSAIDALLRERGLEFDVDAASMGRRPRHRLAHASLSPRGHATMATKKSKKKKSSTDNGIGPHDNGIGPHDNGIGPHDDGIGPHDNGIGPHDNGVGPHDNGVGPHDNGIGPHDNGIGPHKKKKKKKAAAKKKKKVAKKKKKAAKKK